MNIQPLLQAVQDTPVATFIRESGSAFPMLESIHVIGIAIVYGSIAVVDLRLLGVAAHRRGALKLTQDLLPYTWVAFVTCVITGLLMFCANGRPMCRTPRSFSRWAC